MSNLPRGLPRTQTSHETDAALVRAARRDPAAFSALYRRYVKPIYRYLYNRVSNVASAQDLTTQVFVEALEGLGDYREQGSFAAWLFAIARHKVADHYRRQHSHLSLDEAPDCPAQGEEILACLVQQEAFQRLAELVAQLDEDCQELLRLRFAAGLTYSQIGDAVGRSEAAVKMAIHRLLRRLESEWEENNE